MANSQPFWRQPLTHFMLIGAAIFALGALRGDPADNNNKVVVTFAQIERMAAVFEKTWGRPPRDEELQRVVQDYIREEILYREALKLGLDVDDSVIRRRLRQKMEFMTAGDIELTEPTEEELLAFFDKTREKYLTEPAFTFTQVYFSDESRARAAKGDLPNAVGDEINLPRRMADADKSEIAKTFAAGFADALEKLPLNEWSGPVISGFGAHWVKVKKKSAPHTPPVASVRDRVVNDWKNEQRLRRQDAAFQGMAASYDIEIEAPD
ncbi:MAG: peptidyl-prolyl cis-trans isomerase [Marinicaulis sp.]|nr:peptidyl-prolyl cis-trans isomerase [Marinicaulis sp.]NNE41297.1 peptidyl-prolyl cis-trans isomerase [Marinicaulis sp.]NNL88855.1 peptidyl-prolyl cis-trans isomerase [Marinicaulis sp.]